MTEPIKGRQFRCHCGWGFHSLYIPDIDDEFPMIAIQVVNAPEDLSFWQRLKMAWYVLRGEQHVLSEIYIHRNDVQEFVDYVTAIARTFRDGEAR